MKQYFWYQTSYTTYLLTNYNFLDTAKQKKQLQHGIQPSLHQVLLLHKQDIGLYKPNVKQQKTVSKYLIPSVKISKFYTSRISFGMYFSLSFPPCYNFETKVSISLVDMNTKIIPQQKIVFKILYASFFFIPKKGDVAYCKEIIRHEIANPTDKKIAI